MQTRHLRPAVVLLAVGTLTCVMPTDRSGDFRVEVAPLPTLLLKDSVLLDATVVGADGAPVPGAVVAFTSSDATVIAVTAEGVLKAVGVGTATLTISAVGFATATPFTQDLRVRGKLEVDSVLPLNVRFGDTLEIYGVGLDPDSLFAISLGGVEAKVKAFLPDDPQQRDREARLRIWAPPPADRRSAMTLLGFAGGLVFPDTITVAQRDLYEPNDTVPSRLGPLPLGFHNPALAFEPRQRAGTADADIQPADWYTFDRLTTGDQTIVFFSENLGAQAFGVFLTDSLIWSNALNQFIVGPNSWTIGLETYLCGGLGFTRNGEPVKIDEVLFPLSIIAIKDLPAGTYHIFAPYVPFGQPAAYELVVSPGYLSVLNADAAEENDYCDVAAPLPLPGSANLTIDNPHDIDWFRFSVALPTTFTVTATASDPEADLDLYVAQDFRPDSLVLVALKSEPGNAETLTGALLPGDYFLVVVDFPGVPTTYTLSASAVPAPPASVAPVSSDLERSLRQLEAKRAAAGPRRPETLRPGVPERR